MTGGRKRAAGQDAPVPPKAKRPSPAKTNEDNPIDVESLPPTSTTDDTMVIQIKLPPKYDEFPPPLRAQLAVSYRQTCRAHLAALKANNTVWISSHTYSLISDLSSRNDTHAGINTKTLKRDIPTLSVANELLLDTFYSQYSQYVKKTAFVKTEAEGQFTNPEFLQFHSVRRDEIAWGFDVNGCLSLHLVFLEGGRLREYTVFVQRVEGKVKVEE